MTIRCTTPISSRGPCNTPMTVTTNGYGRTVTVCHRCTWRSQQRCWQCGAPRTNHPEFGVYCEPCRAQAARNGWKHSRRDPDRQRAAYERYKATPGYREKRNARLRAWRQANPEATKAQWQRYIERKRQRQAASTTE